MREEVEPVRIRDGKRAIQDGVHQAEDGAVGADAEGERQNGCRREGGTPGELPRGVAQVLAKLIGNAGAAGLAAFFLVGTEIRIRAERPRGQAMGSKILNALKPMQPSLLFAKRRSRFFYTVGHN